MSEFFIAHVGHHLDADLRKEAIQKTEQGHKFVNLQVCLLLQILRELQTKKTKPVDEETAPNPLDYYGLKLQCMHSHDDPTHCGFKCLVLAEKK